VEPVTTDARARQARIAAHNAFDPLWKGYGPVRPIHSRGSAYRWLATRLGLTKEQCHMKVMDYETCQKVIALCGPITDPWRASDFEVIP
jgi:hypothetical protein